MPTSPAFGRRTAPIHPAAPASGDLALDPSAEAFRRRLASQNVARESEFAQWRRKRRVSRVLAWIATFVLLTPGVICFMAAAPWPVSGTLEIVGLAAGWWLRRARKRHIEAITRWAPEAGDA